MDAMLYNVCVKNKQENTQQLKSNDFLLRAHSSHATIKITRGGYLIGNIRSCKVKKEVF